MAQQSRARIRCPHLKLISPSTEEGLPLLSIGRDRSTQADTLLHEELFSMSRPTPLPETGPAGSGSCRLCGLPVRGRSDGFCCVGCSHVFEILKDMLGVTDPAALRSHEFFRRMQAEGIIPSWDDLYKAENPDEAASLPPDESIEQRVLKVAGMWCPSCSWVIEQYLMRKPGVLQVSASFSADRVKVTFLPRLIGPSGIGRAIEELGYEVSALDRQARQEKALRAQLLRLGIALFLTVNVMMISFGIYQGFFTELSGEAVRMMSFPIFLMTTIVVFYCGLPVLERAVKAARAGGIVMETLISLGAIAAYGLSVSGLIRGSLHLYFDTASMLVTLVLLGKYLEGRLRFRAAQGIEEIYELVPEKARILTGAGERYVSIQGITEGDRVLVKEGEPVPVDGEILCGQGAVDESKLTGEPRPQDRRTGDTVLAASLLASGEITVKATGVGASSAIGRMIGLMEEALLAKNPSERITDRMMAVFSPGVILLALLSGAVLYASGRPLEQAIVRTITVLVIACPCALGIATPLARVAAVGRARREGILVVNAEALEAACRLTAMVIDKTGTATEGRYEVLGEDASDGRIEEILGLASALEAGSNHPIARAIRHRASSLHSASGMAPVREEIPGMGIIGICDGQRILVGNASLLESERITLPPDWKEKAAEAADRGETAVFVSNCGALLGMIRLGDRVRPDMGDTVDILKSRGLEVHLVSGDAPAATAHVARQLGVHRFKGGALPADKVEWVRDLQRAGHRVGMVGDGANDAAALAAADVGFATGEALSVSKNASDITLLSFSGSRLISALDLSRLTVKTVVTNLALAGVYNVLALPAAVAGLVNPVVAITAMLLSSLTVVGNSVRIARS